ncbi:MAG: hypothetical protein JRH14_06390 [Deltaproteobacteria bacterium]|nr:hypothetical protein [Deltaproteobacteria bacterium]
MLGNGVTLSLLAIAWLGLAITAGAQEHRVGLTGLYLYSPRSADRLKIERAIDDAVSELGMLKRGIARNRLQQSTKPIPRFQVLFESERVLLCLYHHEFELPLDGRAVAAKGLDGHAVKASVHMGTNVLYQTLEGTQGSRYHEFRVREDGSVSVWTRIESEHLPMRVSYRLNYHRAP